ncbi:MAG: hypothetical protein HXY40_01475 [Chloroflexi bacterium]|nr:hypothetical protein [Chloroflexota bacterium]
MSKRRSRSSIPEETLERARRQAAAQTEESTPAAKPAPAKVEVAASPRARAGTAAARRSAAGSTARKRKEDEKLTPEMVADMLAHPTKEVSEAELEQQYGYVLRDLRSMGLLAASLMIALVVLAQILPR